MKPGSLQSRLDREINSNASFTKFVFNCGFRFELIRTVIKH